MVYIYNRLLFNHRKDEIMLFAATWMDLDIIILSKASQTKKNIWYHLYVESKKKVTNELIYKTETDSEKQIYGYQMGKWGGINWESD